MPEENKSTKVGGGVPFEGPPVTRPDAPVPPVDDLRWGSVSGSAADKPEENKPVGEEATQP